MADVEYYDKECMGQKDSCGGVIECVISGVPAGIGDPVFGKLDALLAGAVMSIGAVKAVEIGDGTQVSQARGSQNNDPFISREGIVSKKTNHAGGILGGISDGSPILFRAHVKPTPSIFSPQETDKSPKYKKTILDTRLQDMNFNLVDSFNCFGTLTERVEIIYQLYEKEVQDLFFELTNDRFKIDYDAPIGEVDFGNGKGLLSSGC